MILDKQNLLSEDQAVTASAASTNVIDLGAVDSAVPGHKKLGRRGRIVVRVSGAADFATLTSLVVTLRTDTVANMASPTTVLSGEITAAAALVPGAVLLDVPVPQSVDERYMDVYYTVAGSDATAGAVTAGITFDEQID